MGRIIRPFMRLTSAFANISGTLARFLRKLPNDSPLNPPQHDRSLDAKGLLCPEPLMIVRNKMREMQPGEVLHVLATDPSTDRDFTNLCRFMGHEMLAQSVDGSCLEYWIRKGR